MLYTLSKIHGKNRKSSEPIIKKLQRKWKSKEKKRVQAEVDSDI